eukprot:IDg2732t1
MGARLCQHHQRDCIAHHTLFRCREVVRSRQVILVEKFNRSFVTSAPPFAYTPTTQQAACSCRMHHSKQGGLYLVLGDLSTQHRHEPSRRSAQSSGQKIACDIFLAYKYRAATRLALKLPGVGFLIAPRPYSACSKN